MKKMKSSVARIVFFALILTFSFMMVAGAISLAAYTNSRYAQRTISTFPTGGDRFSSNRLAKTYSKNNIQIAYSQDEESDPTVRVTVCNYEQGKQSLTYEDDIAYTFTVQLVKYDESQEARYVPVTADDFDGESDPLYAYRNYEINVEKGEGSVTLKGSGNLSHTFNGTLTGNSISYDTYIFTFDVEFATVKPNLYVEVIATPAPAGLPTLRAVFKAGISTQGTVSNLWTGDFTESTSGIAPKYYDGYNYKISGVGSGNFNILWDSSKVELSYNSLLVLGATPTQEGETSYYRVTFAVNADVTAVYELQFQKKNIDSETWGQMNGLISPDTGTVLKYEFVPQS